MVAARVVIVKIEHINIDVLDKLIEEERNEVIGFLGGHCYAQKGEVQLSCCLSVMRPSL